MLRYIKRKIYNVIVENLSIYAGMIKAAIHRAEIKEIESQNFIHGKFSISPNVSFYGTEYMNIGAGFFARPCTRIECISKYNGCDYAPKLIIGRNVYFHNNCHVGCINKIQIGDEVLVGSNVLITDHSHGVMSDTDKDVPWRLRELDSKGPVVIGSNVWICENVCILPNVTIGEGSVIAANSVVTHDIPPYSMAAGNPAKVIKSLLS